MNSEGEGESHCFSSRSTVDFFSAFNLDSRSRSAFEDPSCIVQSDFFGQGTSVCISLLRSMESYRHHAQRPYRLLNCVTDLAQSSILGCRLGKSGRMRLGDKRPRMRSNISTRTQNCLKQRFIRLPIEPWHSEMRRRLPRLRETSAVSTTNKVEQLVQCFLFSANASSDCWTKAMRVRSL